MLLNILILFTIAMAGGLAVYLFPSFTGRNLKLPLIFAGAYLFTLTITHLIPEIYAAGGNVRMIGYFILLGFFVQFVVEYMTSGVEHGHMHEHHPDHHHTSASIFMLMIGLSVHAILEGTLLSEPLDLHDHHDHDHSHVHPHAAHSHGALLLGILLHKMPEAFALMSVFTCEFKKKYVPVMLLVAFSLMTPLGILLGDVVYKMSPLGVNLLFAFVSGNFLHISTTIFFESSPGHRWSFAKLFVIFLGVMLALVADLAMG